jgi:hypothetical protein
MHLNNQWLTLQGVITILNSMHMQKSMMFNPRSSLQCPSVEILRLRTVTSALGTSNSALAGTVRPKLHRLAVLLSCIIVGCFVTTPIAIADTNENAASVVTTPSKDYLPMILKAMPVAI